jgi:hypothetical protein
MVEQDRVEVVLEGRSHEAPHILVAAETMSENHRPGVVAPHGNVVTLPDGQKVTGLNAAWF